MILCNMFLPVLVTVLKIGVKMSISWTPGWLGGEHLPLAQVMIPGFWDQALHPFGAGSLVLSLPLPAALSNIKSLKNSNNKYLLDVYSVPHSC